ncbi:hypothetical protein V8F20_006469 [Naviculisporaceae sp. PSN 640]
MPALYFTVSLVFVRRSSGLNRTVPVSCTRQFRLSAFRQRGPDSTVDAPVPRSCSDAYPLSEFGICPANLTGLCDRLTGTTLIWGSVAVCRLRKILV